MKAFAVLLALSLSGCMFSVGPDGNWLYVEGARGFCSSISLMDYVTWDNGFCVEGDSTASLESEENTPD